MVEKRRLIDCAGVVIEAARDCEVDRKILLRHTEGRKVLRHRRELVEAEADIVAGLREGADDYVVKPAKQGELLARVEVLLRRTHLQMDAGNRAVRLMVDGREISILDKTVAQLVAAGMDVPNPVFPYGFADDGSGLYNWLWTPREPRIAEYVDRAYIEVAAGVLVVGKVLYAESRE